MKTVLIILEGLFICFWLLMICILLIANGPVGGVVFYEQEVQDRSVKLGLITKEKIRKRSMITVIALFLPLFTIVPWFVYQVNGANGFREAFFQLTAILLIMGTFDRLFIDWYWVGHTKAWIIPGTEDLQPYIPGKTMLKKWIGTYAGFPILAAIIAGIAELLFK